MKTMVAAKRTGTTRILMHLFLSSSQIKMYLIVIGLHYECAQVFLLVVQV